jgi:hypothetical protein
VRLTVKIPTYDASLLLLVGVSPKKANSAISKYLERKDEYIDTDCAGTGDANGRRAFIWLEQDGLDHASPADIALLTHELSHALGYLLKSVGARRKPESEEWAYLFESVMKSVLTRVKKHNIKQLSRMSEMLRDPTYGAGK